MLRVDMEMTMNKSNMKKPEKTNLELFDAISNMIASATQREVLFHSQMANAETKGEIQKPWSMSMNKNEMISMLRHFKDNNQKKYNILRIGIFGSVARGNMTEQSDIDIVVETDKQDLFNFIGMKQDLEKKICLSVDIVSYRKNMNPFLKQRIDEEAIYV